MMHTTRLLMMVGTIALSACSPLRPWTLPPDATVMEHGPRTYRFVVEHFIADPRGRISQRERVVGEYTRGLPTGEVVWHSVAVERAKGADEPYGSASKSEFMEGFRYPVGSNSLAADFFKGFPPSAVYQRNLVWDTAMLELFGQARLPKLRLNQPYHEAGLDSRVVMPGVGTFDNRNTQLTWIGLSRRNGQDCALVSYSTFFNPVTIDNGGMHLQGRSHYWGQIWVSLSTRQIEYATLEEDVIGMWQMNGAGPEQVINVVRRGIFEPIAAQ